MKQSSLKSLFSEVADLFRTVYAWLVDDAKKMQVKKAEYLEKQLTDKEKREMAEEDLKSEWTVRGREGHPWYVRRVDDDEEILGI